MNNLISILQTQ